MALLKVLERLFMMLNGRLQLLDVLGPPFTESRLCLTISLLPFLGRCVYLAHVPSGTVPSKKAANEDLLVSYHPFSSVPGLLLV